MLFNKSHLLELSEIDVGETTEEGYLTLIEMGNWISNGNGKYEYQTIIFEHSGKFYQLSDNRTGSYYTDYSYGSEYWGDQVDCPEVEKVEVIKYEWKIKH